MGISRYNSEGYSDPTSHAALSGIGHLGLPIPEKLRDILAQLHDRAENGKEDEDE